MKLVLTSDFHGSLPEIPECDLLIIAGDICPVNNHRKDYHRAWLETDFQQWINDVPADKIVATWGNHDFFGESEPHFEVEGVEWLVDETTEYEGLKIHGSPWCNRFGNWAWMEDEPVLEKLYELIPDDVDILFTHGPMYGLGDVVARGGEHVGSKTLRDRISQLESLKLHVSGHIHEDYGQWELDNGATSLNVSHMNLSYWPVNKPVVWEL